jgi:hypothetical protein
MFDKYILFCDCSHTSPTTIVLNVLQITMTLFVVDNWIVKCKCCVTSLPIVNSTLLLNPGDDRSKRESQSEHFHFDTINSDSIFNRGYRWNFLSFKLKVAASRNLMNILKSY